MSLSRKLLLTTTALTVTMGASNAFATQCPSGTSTASCTAPLQATGTVIAGSAATATVTVANGGTLTGGNGYTLDDSNTATDLLNVAFTGSGSLDGPIGNTNHTYTTVNIGNSSLDNTTVTMTANVAATGATPALIVAAPATPASKTNTFAQSSGTLNASMSLAQGAVYNYAGGTLSSTVDANGATPYGTVNFNASVTPAAALGGTHPLLAVNVNSGTTTLASTVAATTTTVASGATLAGSTHNITGAVVNNGTHTSTSGTISTTLTNTGTYSTATGGVTGNATNTGSLASTGAASFGGNVTNGSTTNSTATSTMASTTGITGNLVNYGVHTFSGAGTVGGTTTNNSGASLTTGTGTFTGAVTNSGAMTNNGAAFSSTLANSGTYSATVNHTVTGNITNNISSAGGTVSIQPNITLTASGTFDNTSGTVISVVNAAGTQYGKAAVTGAYTNSGSTHILDTGAFIGSTGSLANVITAASGLTSVSFISKNPLMQVTTTHTAGTAVAVSAQPHTAASLAAATGATFNTNQINVMTPLMQYVSANGTNNALVNGMFAASQASQLPQFLSAVAGKPAVSGTAGGKSAANEESSRVIATQLASLRNVDAASELEPVAGVSAGDLMSDSARAWVQPFGAQAVQKTKNYISGYKANTAGVAIGVDDKFTDNLTLGVAATYADTDLKGKDAAGSKTNTRTTLGTLYGSYDLQQWFLEGMASVGYSKNKAHSNILYIGTRYAKYNSNEVGGELGAGYRLQNSGFNITPKVSVDYTHLNVKGYTESGMAARVISKQKHDSSTARAVVDFAYPTPANGGVFTPSVYVGGGYDLKNKAMAQTATFVGGTTAYTTNGIKPSKGSFIGGVKLAFKQSDAMTITANYDYEGRSKFSKNAGYLRIRFGF